ERRVHERRAQNSDEPVQVARPDAEVIHVPAEQPGAEPGQPDAGHESDRTDHGIAHARAVARYRGGSEFRCTRGYVHGDTMGPDRRADKAFAREPEPAQTSRRGEGMGLDIRTLIMLAAALTLFMGLSLRYVLREYPADLLPSIRLWTLGIL